MSATYVYVSNADDGDIGVYSLQPDGRLRAMARAAAVKPVMPLAVSPDRRFLYAAIRSKPFSVFAYAIDARSGSLGKVSTAPLPESYPYISTDRTGRFLFGASYGGDLVGVHPIEGGGRLGEAQQVIPVGRNAHCILVDHGNRYVFASMLGTDQVFQFVFDASTGRLAANTPPVLQLEAGTGPRHMAFSSDNRFLYVLSELLGTVTTLALDAGSGQLSEVGSVSMLPPDTALRPGMPRGGVGSPAASQAPRDTANDIWASDLRLTPDNRFLYAAERTGSTLAWLGRDAVSGKLTRLGSIPTEKQPRGIAIDPTGKYLVASGEKSDTISVYAIGSEGAPAFLDRYPSGKGSNWVEIVATE
ncbi:MAG TPA: beta-propeller fold lactonase family protein [Usitatibacter sp.]|nr:beta-propeller fold lactonase family protein [Usitatibacter sp.]